MSTMGDILSTVRCSVPWGLSWVLWGILSTVGDIMMHVWRHHEYHGGIPSFEIYVPWGYNDTCGGYHEYRGVFSTVGYSNNKRFFPPWY